MKKPLQLCRALRLQWRSQSRGITPGSVNEQTAADVSWSAISMPLPLDRGRSCSCLSLSLVLSLRECAFSASSGMRFPAEGHIPKKKNARSKDTRNT